jgi:hypothetical protein
MVRSRKSLKIRNWSRVQIPSAPFDFLPAGHRVSRGRLPRGTNRGTNRPDFCRRVRLPRDFRCAASRARRRRLQPFARRSRSGALEFGPPHRSAPRATTTARPSRCRWSRTCPSSRRPPESVAPCRRRFQRAARRTSSSGPCDDRGPRVRRCRGRAAEDQAASKAASRTSKSRLSSIPLRNLEKHPQTLLAAECEIPAFHDELGRYVPSRFRLPGRGFCRRRRRLRAHLEELELDKSLQLRLAERHETDPRQQTDFATSGGGKNIRCGSACVATREAMLRLDPTYPPS